MVLTISSITSADESEHMGPKFGPMRVHAKLLNYSFSIFNFFTVLAVLREPFPID